MVKLKEFFLLGPAEAAGEDERLLKDLLASSSDKEGERRFFDGLHFPIPVAHTQPLLYLFFLHLDASFMEIIISDGLGFFVILDLIYGFPDSKL